MAFHQDHISLRKGTSSHRSSEAAREKLRKLKEFPEVQSWIVLLKSFQKVYRSLEQELLKQGCSISRFQILLHLYFEKPLSAAEIAKTLLVTRGNISMFVKRLRADGLITVHPSSQSSKRPLFCLTREGEQLFEKVFPGHIERVRGLMPILGPGTIRALHAIPAPSVLPADAE